MAGASRPAVDVQLGVAPPEVVEFAFAGLGVVITT
jgi:hypothetical protein